MNTKQNSYARSANKARLLGNTEDPKANKWMQLVVELLAAGGGTLCGIIVPKASLVGLAGIVGSRFLDHAYASPAVRGFGYGLLLAPAVKSSDPISSKMDNAKQALMAKLPFGKDEKDSNAPAETVAGIGAIEYFSFPELQTIEPTPELVRPMVVQQISIPDTPAPMDLLDYIELQLIQKAENHVEQLDQERLKQTVQEYEVTESVSVSGIGPAQNDIIPEYLDSEAHNY